MNLSIKALNMYMHIQVLSIDGLFKKYSVQAFFSLSSFTLQIRISFFLYIGGISSFVSVCSTVLKL